MPRPSEVLISVILAVVDDKLMLHPWIWMRWTSMARWRLSIAYDSPALPKFKEGWGFSAVISSDAGNILFDCGWDARILQDNLSRLGFTFSDMDLVVLSHYHWDHLTGLPVMLSDPSVKRTLEVIVPYGFSKNLMKEIRRMATVREVRSPQEVFPEIWATGPLGGDVPEQALILKGESGVAILTGCGHPGLNAILSAGSSIGVPKWLIGGLHDCTLSDLESSLRENPSLTAVLCHCTRCKDEASAAHIERVSIGAAGEIYEVEL